MTKELKILMMRMSIYISKLHGVFAVSTSGDSLLCHYSCINYSGFLLYNPKNK